MSMSAQAQSPFPLPTSDSMPTSQAVDVARGLVVSCFSCGVAPVLLCVRLRKVVMLDQSVSAA
jgi:hypothetical protein